MFKFDSSFQNGIAFVRLFKNRRFFSKTPWIEDVVTQLVNAKSVGALFDVSKSGRLSYAELGGLVELLTRVQRDPVFAARSFAIGLCGVGPRAMSQFEAHGLDKVIPLFHDRSSAMGSPAFKGLQLRGARAVFLCAEKTARLAPLTTETPASMLDILGKPLLERNFEGFGRFGVSDFVVTLGHLGAQISNHCKGQSDRSVFFVKEDVGSDDPVAMLHKLDEAHCVFQGDTIVQRGNLLTDVDVCAMMDEHRANKADITVAMRPDDNTQGKGSKDAGVFIFSPRVFEEHRVLRKSVSLNHMLEGMQKRGANIRYFHSEHIWLPIENGRGYFAAIAGMLTSQSDWLKPVGREIEQGVWVSDGADIGRRTRFEGQSFVGAKARIESATILKGNCVVGSNCVVETQSVLNNSIIRPNTRVEARSVVDHMIAGASWAVSHKFADGSLQNRTPLEGVASAIEPMRADTREVMFAQTA